MSADLQNPIFTNEDAAREALEAMRWPNGPVCPHCGNVDQAAIAKAKGKTPRQGLYYCAACNGQFTATIGTVLEHSKIPLSKWWLAMHLLGSSKKGISSHQLHRMLGVTYKTAWFMTHRIRLAMQGAGLTPMGGEGSTVEIDETIIGKQEGAPKDAKFHGSNFRNIVLTLVERGGSSRSFHVDGSTIGTLMPIIRANIAKGTAVMTDSAVWYKNMNSDGHFASHETVDHSKDEYVRGHV